MMNLNAKIENSQKKSAIRVEIATFNDNGNVNDDENMNKNDNVNENENMNKKMNDNVNENINNNGSEDKDDITVVNKDDKIIDTFIINEKENLRKNSRRMSRSEVPFLRQLSKSKSFNKVADDVKNNRNNDSDNNYIKNFNTSSTNTDLDFKKRKIPLMRSISLSGSTLSDSQKLYVELKNQMNLNTRRFSRKEEKNFKVGEEGNQDFNSSISNIAEFGSHPKIEELPGPLGEKIVPKKYHKRTYSTL